MNQAPQLPDETDVVCRLCGGEDGRHDRHCPGWVDPSSPKFAIVHVRDGRSGDAWPVVERVAGGWQSGAHHYPDSDVLDVRPLAAGAVTQATCSCASVHAALAQRGHSAIGGLASAVGRAIDREREMRDEVYERWGWLPTSPTPDAATHDATVAKAAADVVTEIATDRAPVREQRDRALDLAEAALGAKGVYDRPRVLEELARLRRVVVGSADTETGTDPEHPEERR